MKLSVIHSGYFKLDGGAMFGVVPKKLWNKLNPADENNMCTWALRCLLLETEDRKILFDTGMGSKQSDKFLSHFEPHGSYTLVDSLKQNGVHPDEITDVFITHLHFDHVGGALKKEKNKIVPQFKNAKYWSNKDHWEWAKNPNARERASFIQENFLPMEEMGNIHFIPVKENIEWIPGINITFAYGHTEAMMIPIIQLSENTRIAYCADLMPSSFHIRMPYVMSYDIRPLQTLREKRAFLERVIDEDIFLFFEHDPVNECGKVAKDIKGRYHFIELFNLVDALQ